MAEQEGPRLPRRDRIRAQYGEMLRRYATEQLPVDIPIRGLGLGMGGGEEAGPLIHTFNAAYYTRIFFDQDEVDISQLWNRDLPRDKVSFERRHPAAVATLSDEDYNLLFICNPTVLHGRIIDPEHPWPNWIHHSIDALKQGGVFVITADLTPVQEEIHRTLGQVSRDTNIVIKYQGVNTAPLPRPDSVITNDFITVGVKV